MNGEFLTFLLQLVNIRTADLVERTRLVLKHKYKQSDPRILRLFPNHNVQCYRVLCIGHVRLPTSSYSYGKTSDDSNILFRLNETERFGRLCSIFTTFGE